MMIDFKLPHAELIGCYRTPRSTRTGKPIWIVIMEHSSDGLFPEHCVAEYVDGADVITCDDYFMAIQGATKAFAKRIAQYGQ